MCTLQMNFTTNNSSFWNMCFEPADILRNWRMVLYSKEIQFFLQNTNFSCFVNVTWSKTFIDFSCFANYKVREAPFDKSHREMSNGMNIFVWRFIFSKFLLNLRQDYPPVESNIIHCSLLEFLSLDLSNTWHFGSSLWAQFLSCVPSSMIIPQHKSILEVF